MRIVGSEQLVGGDLEYRSQVEREYARCRITEYRFAVEDWGISSEFWVEIGRTCWVLRVRLKRQDGLSAAILLSSQELKKNIICFH